MRILVFYGSTHGHTRRVAEHIAARARAHGHDVSVSSRLWRVRASSYDAIIVGGRVHGSAYPWRVTHFIRRNLRALQARPSAFYSVSLLQLARSPIQRSKTMTLPRWAAAKRGWNPDLIEVVAGALDWKRQYGRLAPLAKRMWRHTLGPELDVTLSQQTFTDWPSLDRFVDAFHELATMPTQRQTERTTKVSAGV
jgi:menaquinone-dependent protoporphyrinogen oxidase